MIKLLSFDTSTTMSGWAVYENGEYVKSGLIDLHKSRKSAQERIDEMCKEIVKILAKEKPDIIAVEKLNVNRNMNTVRELCRVIDVCYFYALFAGNCRFQEMSPSEWRGGIGIKAKYKERQRYKKLAQEYAIKHFKEDIGEDEAEAICIGASYVSQYLAINKYRFDEGE